MGTDRLRSKQADHKIERWKQELALKCTKNSKMNRGRAFQESECTVPIFNRAWKNEERRICLTDICFHLHTMKECKMRTSFSDYGKKGRDTSGSCCTHYSLIFCNTLCTFTATIREQFQAVSLPPLFLLGSLCYIWAIGPTWKIAEDASHVGICHPKTPSNQEYQSTPQIIQPVSHLFTLLQLSLYYDPLMKMETYTKNVLSRKIDNCFWHVKLAGRWRCGLRDENGLWLGDLILG